MRWLVVIAWCGIAHADRPTDGQAKKTATAWIAAMHFGGDGKPDPSSTATPLFAAAYDDNGATCPETTATTADAIGKLLGCLHDKIAPKGKPKVWTKKSAQNLGGPIAAHAKRLTALRKAAALVELDEGCDGMENQVILAITNDKKHGLRVAAVVAQTVTCGE